ncbi:uncharacterized protein LOC110249992 [Exaiptasia diaphana]|uniref:Uncharacterized protein n=1 Tax=Exaiptasia diaphana TaxID=2652724 RepID=A0A913XZ97_EXADI|nr:uncharacterized protein LOC110249992 [Exaiptasia diaphana]
MKIICAGLQKTGTKSMAAALRILGFTVHDYDEHNVYYLNEYLDAMDGKIPDFTTMYKDVDATTDIPASLFWEEIKESFPEAKVVLMVRESAESWVDSMLHTRAVVFQNVKQFSTSMAMSITPTGRKWWKLYEKCSIRMRFDDKEKMPPVYTKHNARVKATIPRDELLVYNVKQGWKPLCEFLGVEVPDVPFPRLNVKSSAIPDIVNYSGIGKIVYREALLVLIVFVVIVTLLVFIFVN